jgi:hypothetical protein
MHQHSRNSTCLEHFPKLPEQVHQKYIKTVGAQAPEPGQTLNKDEIDFEQDEVEIDEIWTYIGRKTKEH